MNLKWSTNNSKLRKTHTIALPLPAQKTCPAAGACKQFCYASKGCYQFPVVKQAREHNLTMSLRSDFVRLASEDLNRMRNIKTVRLHDSGDIYNQSYLNKLVELCQRFPEIKFYAYTKSIHLNFGSLPKNLLIIFSFGGKYDNRINLRKHHARVFNTRQEMIKAGYSDGNGKDLPSLPNCPKKIGLVLH